VHDFYLGYKKFGIIHVAIAGGGLIMVIIGMIIVASTAVNVWGVRVPTASGWGIGGILTLIGWLAMAGSGIWGLITGIMCLTKSGQYGHDANGVPLI
jgi:hypothetical protein